MKVKRFLLQHYHALLAALQFLTLIPIPVNLEWSSTLQQRAVLYYPFVGALLGLILAVLSGFLHLDSSFLEAAILMAIWVSLTGALHLDGLADSADGWMGGLGNRDKTLLIMKDPKVGVTAVVVLIMTCILKWAALQALIESDSQPLLLCTLVLAPVLGRTAAVILLATTPYVRPRGIASEWVNLLTKQAVIIPCAVVTVLTFIWAPFALVAAGAVLVACRIAMVRRLGGTTGDTAGATIELVELAVLLVMNAYIS